MKLHLQKFNKSFIPSTDEDREIFNKLSPDEVYYLEIKKVRNPQFHRKFFALINLGFNNLPEQYESICPNIEVFRSQMLVMAGHFEVLYDFDGKEMIKAKSINFATVDDIEFSRIYQDVLNVMHVVQLVQFQRQGAGTTSTAGTLKEILMANGDSVVWTYDDTLIGAGAGGADAGGGRPQ